MIFTPVDKLANYHCAVLLLVDKTLGNGKDTNDKTREKLWKAVHDTMGRFSAVADTTLTKSPSQPFPPETWRFWRPWEARRTSSILPSKN